MSAMLNPASAEIGIEHSNKPAVLPMLRPTIGPPLADIRGLYREAGCYAYDPALGETGICRSAITYVDGDNGVLLYRGYPIADLVERCSYLEICWLLLNGELPTGGQLDKFTDAVKTHAAESVKGPGCREFRGSGPAPPGAACAIPWLCCCGLRRHARATSLRSR